MKLILFIFLSSCFCFHATHANERAKRQLGGYRFPGPRTDNYDEYPKARVVKREPQYEERPEYRSSASGYRSQAAAASPSYGSSQSYGYPPNNKKPDQYDSEPTREEKEEKEEEKKPSRLELLLAESKFSCGSKKDGYYADLSVGCQVFHYCVAGVKHSWQCPEQTVFHQVHLNCVPASQDICSQSEKFFVVNDYLHKEMDQRGPNNTVRYHQRFYPEEFLGDAALNQPQSWPPQAAPARQSSYPSRPASSQSYPDDDGYSSSRGSSQPSHQNYPSQSYPSRESEPASYRATSRPTSPPQYSRPESSYPAPATYSRPTSSYSAGSSSHSAGSSSYPSTSGSSYPRPATRYSSAPASYSAPSSAYTSSPASYSNSPSSYSNSPSSYSNSPSSYSSGSGSGYQPLSSRASSAIPSSYQPLSSPPSSYSRPVPSSYKKVVPVTPLPRTLPSYPSYNSLPSKPYGSSSGLYGAGSSGRSMTSSLFAPDVLGFKSGVIYESDF